MIRSPYKLIEKWVQNHECTDTVGRYQIKYVEVEKNIYKVTCKKCGATTTIENR